MKLPNYKNAYIPNEKLTEYLLSETHPTGNSKAKLFRSLGFNETNTSLLLLIQYNIEKEIREMLKELDVIVLTHSIKEYNLEKGDLGTVVHCYKDNEAVEVEFVAASGKTIAVLTLNYKDVRPMVSHEILHARDFATA